MSQRIFTNGEEGKILTSVGNRIVKQPYEFGNAFQNRMGLNNYIAINNLNIPLDNSFMGRWVNGTTIAYMMAVTSNNRKWQITARGSDNIIAIPNGTFFDGGSLSNLRYFADQCLNGVYTHYTGSGYDFSGATTDISGTYTSQNITNIYIGAGNSNFTNSTGTTIDTYSNGATTHSVIYLFDRQLSLSESKYIFNNGLGNDPISSLGLQILLKCDKAEVINILGVDQPCVRDYSGNNRHGIIMNLPAGTVQQKVDYANANLFVPFI